jgi:hypothetical protein
MNWINNINFKKNHQLTIKKKVDILILWFKNQIKLLCDFKANLILLNQESEKRKLSNNSIVFEEVFYNLDLINKKVNDIINKLYSIDSLTYDKKIYFQYYQLYRYYINVISGVITWLDWQSISYESSLIPNILDVNEFDYWWDLAYKRVNYPNLIKKEKYFLQNCTEFKNSNKNCCLLTSSWQWAYSTVENMILRILLKKNDKIAYINQAYFETR